MQLVTLGDLRLEGSDFTRPKPLLLLCYLALEGAQSRRLLSELFFRGTRDPRDALSTSFRRLRRLGDGLAAADGDRVVARVGCDALDLLTALDGGEFEAAVELYSGAFLAGLDVPVGEELEEWVFATREYLAARVREAHLSLGDDLRVAGESTAAARHAEAALGLGGVSELEPEEYPRVYRLLIAGRSPRALALREEAEALGISLEVEPRNARSGPPAEGTSVAHGLPPQISSFVGRDPELLEIARLLGEPHCRLLTLHGPGGVGKTRLALQAGYDQLAGQAFRDGVFFVSMSPYSDAEQIPVAISKSLDMPLRGRPAPLDQVTDFVGEKRILLILDNLEQLEVGTVLSTLIEACPQLKILATSRNRLELEEEHVLTLEGLAVPEMRAELEESQYVDALRLLVQRVKKTQRGFRLTEETLPHAVRICALVGGYPLGIELAAAWGRALPLSEIAAEIEKNLDFLVASSTNTPERQRSLRAVFESSWALLTAKDRDVVRKLAVFRGGFRREAAGSVAGATLPGLVRLVDRSLLRVLPDGRFDRHPLTDQFSLEKLSEHPQDHRETHARHARYYLALADEAKIYGASQRLWLDRLDAEHDNFKAALEWADASGSTELGLKLAGALGGFWYNRGYFSEGRQHLATVLARAGNDRSGPLARALNAAAMLAFRQGDYDHADSLWNGTLEVAQQLENEEEVAGALNNLGYLAWARNDFHNATRLLHESLEKNRSLGHRQGESNNLNNLGLVAWSQGELERARSRFEESASLKQALGDEIGESHSRYNLGNIAWTQGRLGEARTHFEQSLALYRSLGDQWGVATTLNSLGNVARAQGDYPLAAAQLQESLRLQRELGNRKGIALALSNLGKLAQLQRDFSKATAHYAEALRIQQGLADNLHIGRILKRLAHLALETGDHSRSAYLWGASCALLESIQATEPADEQPQTRALDGVRTHLGENTFAARWEAGRETPLQQVIAYALRIEGVYVD